MDDIVIAFVELDIGFVRSVRIKTSAPMAKEYRMGYGLYARTPDHNARASATW